MAYIRGHFYIYSYGDGLFFGHGPHESEQEGPRGAVEDNSLCSFEKKIAPDGVDLPSYIVEEFVVMYYERMDEETRLEAEKRVIDKYGGGNIGADAVAKKHGNKTVMEIVKDEVKGVKST